MLDPTQAERMGRNLAAIVRYAPRLDAAKYPRAGNVENAGLAPAAPRSRPPALMHPVDLEITACDTLRGWLANLADDYQLPPAWFVGPANRAGHLAARLGQVVSHIATREWGADAADEIDAVARQIIDYCEPPEPDTSASAAAPGITAFTTGAAAERLMTATDIATALHAAGVTVTADQIRKWRDRGHITAHGTNRAGRSLYRLGDVARRALEGANHA